MRVLLLTFLLLQALSCVWAQRIDDIQLSPSDEKSESIWMMEDVSSTMQYYSRRRRNVDNQTFIDRRRFENKLGLELYTGGELAFWNVSFAESGSSASSSMMRRVDRDAFTLMVARARLVNLFGFQVGAEAKASNASSFQALFDKRNVSVITGQDGAEISAISTRNLDFLHYLLHFGEKRNPNAWFNHTYIDFEFNRRQYNWNFQVAQYVERDGSVVLPSANETSIFPGDVSENRISLRFSVLEAFTTIADGLRKPDYQRWNPSEEIIYAFFMPSVAVGWFGQRITSPFEIVARDRNNDNFQTRDTRGVFIVDNEYSGLLLKFNMSDPNLRLHRIRQPYLFNVYWNILMGTGRLNSAALTSDSFYASSHEFGADLLIRPNSWMSFRTGYKYHTYRYGPLGDFRNDLELNAQFKETYTFNGRTINPSSTHGLRFFRGDNFHSLYFELTFYI